MKKILVIEDSQEVRESIAEVLEVAGYQILLAENGEIGYLMAEQEVPDLIICDIVMPKMTGYEVLKKLKENSLTQTTPIIFITAKGDRVEQRYGMELGADDYLVKPFDSSELLAAIASRLEKNNLIQSQIKENINELRNNISLALPHEFNTALHGMIGSAQFLKEFCRSIPVDQIEEMADLFLTSAQRLQRLTENFLVYTELQFLLKDRDKLELLKQQEFRCNVSYYLHNIANSKAREYGRVLDLNLKIEENLIANIEDIRFIKIIQEVLDNAFKFSTEETQVIIKCWQNLGNIEIAITNYGYGMSQEQIKKIGAYQQFDRLIYEQQGLGLGLVIAKIMTEIYGGSIIIESIVDQVTTVKLQFLAITD
jgi:two-component system, sensor histidine kinase and response regulator